MIFPTDNLSPFTVKRVVAPGGNACSSPRVTGLVISPLKVENLKAMLYSERDVTMTRGCTIENHDYCKGHLQVDESGELGLPQYVINDDEIMMDERARANLDLFTSGITPLEYATRIRSTMLGKRGLLRGHLMSIRPMTGSRGVATCDWDAHPHVVYLPRIWMKRMKLPARREGPDGLLSSRYFCRPLEDGDCGVVLRCPVILEGSIKPVIFMGWDNDTIGIHPSACKEMNLDYDGDELHIAGVSSSKSREEILLAIENSTSTTFSDEHIRSSLHEELQFVQDEDLDFMMSSTCSIDELDEVDYDEPSFKISRCKEGPRAAMVDAIQNSTLASTFVDKSFKKIKEVTKSHLSVSDGYVFSRQLKIIAMESQIEGEAFCTKWRPNIESTSYTCSLSPTLGKNCIGFPAVRLITKLTSKLIQSSLDLAKHKNNSDDSSMILSLFSNIGVETAIVRRKEKLSVERFPITQGRSPLDYSSRLVASTYRPKIASVFDSPTLRRNCLLIIIKYICEALSIKADRDEIADLASMLFASLDVNSGNNALTSTMPVKFLSLTACNYLTSAICENAAAIDSLYLSKITMRHTTLETSSPVVAIASGGMSSILKRTIA